MRCLVTGATGFLGSHLVDFLLERGDQVTVLVRDPEKARARWAERVRIESAELTDRLALEAVLHRAGPGQVYHLAAQTLPTASWKDPQATFRTNLTGTVALFEAIRAWGGKTRILVVSSSAAYAVTHQGQPLTEDAAMGPISPYGVSKLAADASADLYAHRYQLDVIRVRPFYVIGPRKQGDACADFSRRMAKAEKSGRGAITVGNLDMVRDLLDVRDGIAGLVTAVEKGQAGEVYNLCSGRGYAMRDVLDRLKRFARLPIREQHDPSLLRPVDEPIKVGNPAKLMSLGWAPCFSLEESLQEILDYWRARVAADED